MVALKDIAKALGVTPQRVTAMVRQGMPTGSIEEAVEWREARRTATSAPIPTQLESLDDGTLAATIQRHRRLVATAQGVWESAMSSGDPNQGKYQTAYNQSLKTLVALEEEQERRAVSSKVFIQREEAESTVREIVGEILDVLDKVGLECAEKANPDNPALASKVLDAWARSARERLSRE